MKLGILLADDLRDELAPQFGCYSDMFCRLLADGKFEFEVFDIRQQAYPPAVNACDGYLITGSRHSTYESLAWMAPLFDYIRVLAAAKKPLLGICFGHQVVAQALGGKVEKSAKGWGLGLNYWRVVEYAEWMRPKLLEVTPYFRLLASHQDQVISLPPLARVLCSSDFCPYAAYAIGSSVFCLQGHPEFSADFIVSLLDYRRDELPAEQLQFIADTASLPNDSRICSDWICNFFTQQAGR